MTYGLDAAFARAVDDDGITVIVLAGAGDHFSAGHDIGTPERDADKSFTRQVHGAIGYTAEHRERVMAALARGDLS